MIKIALVELGHIKHRVDIDKIIQWKSDIFEISATHSIPNLPDGKLAWQHFSDSDLSFVKSDASAKMTIAITAYALDDDYFARRLDDSIIVLSLDHIGDILHQNDIPIENFLLKCIYEYCLIRLLHGSIPPSTNELRDILHDETRSCIFDICGIKEDIVYSSSTPQICDACQTKIAKKQLPKDTISLIIKELRKIKQPLYYRLESIIKRHPFASLLVTFFAGLLLEIIGSAAYELFRLLLF